jgi:hypothetical protein
VGSCLHKDNVPLFRACRRHPVVDLLDLCEAPAPVKKQSRCRRAALARGSLEQVSGQIPFRVRQVGTVR